MLLKEEPDFTLEDYQNRAFRDDPEENGDEIKTNMSIFNSYACGGIEYLYNIFQGCERIEDTVDTLFKFLHDFSTDVGLIDGDTELPDFVPEFS